MPDCLESLARAGIKVWVLTGDKVETAISIAYSCRLFNEEMAVVELREADIGPKAAKASRLDVRDVEKGTKVGLGQGARGGEGRSAQRLVFCVCARGSVLHLGRALVQHTALRWRTTLGALTRPPRPCRVAAPPRPRRCCAPSGRRSAARTRAWACRTARRRCGRSPPARPRAWCCLRACVLVVPRRMSARPQAVEGVEAGPRTTLRYRAPGVRQRLR